MLAACQLGLLPVECRPTLPAPGSRHSLAKAVAGGGVALLTPHLGSLLAGGRLRMRIRLAILSSGGHRARAAVYESHPRLRRALGAPSRLLEPLPASTPLSAAASLCRSRPILIAALGADVPASGPPPEPPFDSAEFFSFESIDHLRTSLRAATSDLDAVRAEREASGVASRIAGLRCPPDQGQQFGAAGSQGGEPCGLGHDVGILLTARARDGVDSLELQSACAAHARLVGDRASDLAFRHALHGATLAPSELAPVAELAEALGERVALSELDLLACLAYHSLGALAAAAASPRAQAAVLALVRHEAQFAHAPATVLTLVRWRPVPRALERSRAEVRAEAEDFARLPVGIALGCQAAGGSGGAAGARTR